MSCPFYTIGNWMRWLTNPGRIAISIHLAEPSIIASCNMYRSVRTFAWQQRVKKIAVWLHRLVAIVHSGFVRSRTPSPNHSVRPLPIYCRCSVLLIRRKQLHSDNLVRKGNSNTIYSWRHWIEMMIDFIKKRNVFHPCKVVTWIVGRTNAFRASANVQFFMPAILLNILNVKW